MTIEEYITRNNLTTRLAMAPTALMKKFDPAHDIELHGNADQSRISGICRKCNFFALYKPEAVTMGKVGKSYPTLQSF
jgi:hypothetical protein